MAPSLPQSVSRRSPLRLEELERRDLRSGFQPTDLEQLFLEKLNDARANPAAFGVSIGLDLSSIPPSPPLAFNPLLIEAARRHSQDMNDRGYFAHDTPEGTTPGQRLMNAGFAGFFGGESLVGGGSVASPDSALKTLLIDNGNSNPTHRNHLLSVGGFAASNQVGIGAWSGSGPWSNYWTIDTGAGSDPRPLITGVVFADANGNGHYDAGEGLGNVTITIAGAGSTVTYGSGGYSIQVNPGSYTVTASGGGLAVPITQTVAVGASNVRLNFIGQRLAGGTPVTQPSNARPAAVAVSGYSADEEFVHGLYTDFMGRPGSIAELDSWVDMLPLIGREGVAGQIARSPEALGRVVGGFYLRFLGRAADPAGEAAWVGILETGATEEDVMTGILGSPEFAAHAQALVHGPDAGVNLIKALYGVALNRRASAAEVGAWESALPTLGEGGLAARFVDSVEFRDGALRTFYGDRSLPTFPYQPFFVNLLHRSGPPADAELSSWVNAPIDLLDIAIQLAGSPEYAALHGG